MKRILSLVLTFILTVTLASCGKEEAITGMEYVEGQDQQYFYSDLGSNTLFTETEDGYYYFVVHYLCYTDKETMQSTVLCGRPDCLHQNETNPERTLDCNAYFSGAQFLQYYDGNLYVVSRAFPGRFQAEKYPNISQQHPFFCHPPGDALLHRNLPQRRGCVLQLPSGQAPVVR